LIARALLLAFLFSLPGLTLLATAAARGAVRWPWPRGVAIVLALGVTIAGLVAVALGIAASFSLLHETLAVGALSAAVAACGRWRFAWPFRGASGIESAGFLAVATLALALFVGRPFEMLLGERDATVYTLSGIGLARQGSLVLVDRAAERIGDEAARRFYPLQPRQHDTIRYLPQHVKYPGFYYVDTARRHLIGQGLPLLPGLIAVFYAAFGLWGAFVANNFIGVIAVLCVLAAGTELVGELGALLGVILLTLDLVEVWAARYPVAEVLFQMLLFAAAAAFLHRGRLGEGISGFLFAAACFAKIETALILLPLGAFLVVALLRRRLFPGAWFWAWFLATLAAALAYWVFFQSDYARVAFLYFSRFHSRILARDYRNAGNWMVPALLLLIVSFALISAVRSRTRWHGTARAVGPTLAVAVVVFFVFGYWGRPHLVGLLSGQAKTLVWLGWYVGGAVLFVGAAGLAHFLWTRSRLDNLFVLSLLLVLALVFLHFTFVKLHHIYMTRRFVPAALPLVCLFFGYAVTCLARIGVGVQRIGAVAAASLLFVACALAIVDRSRHLYPHREYAALARSMEDLAGELSKEDLVLVSDRKTRNLLGATLEFAFDVPIVVAGPHAYAVERERMGGWLDQGMAVGALTSEVALETIPAAEEFEPVAHPVFWLHTLAAVLDRFPNDFIDDTIVFTRYAAGRGSDPLYEFWRREGSRVSEAVCGSGVRLLGGNRYLVRRVRRRCEATAPPASDAGYLAGDADAAIWQRTLEAYGARFRRRDLGGAVLFDEIAPRSAPGARRLPASAWTAEATDGSERLALAFDGRLDTRWGTGRAQQPGMSITLRFSAPADVDWLRIRMGHLATDRARALAVETSVDGKDWNRQEVPTVVDGIRWQNGLPEENANGDVDLWVGQRGIRFLRLVNLGENRRFDWSIAEIEIDGAIDAPRA